MSNAFKIGEAAASVERTPASRSHLPPAPREPSRATDIWVSLSTAAVLGMTAVAVALWPTTEQRAKVAVQAVVVPTTSINAGTPTHEIPAGLQRSPMRFTNPFDATEVFEFPTGTTKDAARESVAEALLQRARERERRTEIGSAKDLHSHRSPPLVASPLTPKSITHFGQDVRIQWHPSPEKDSNVLTYPIYGTSCPKTDEYLRLAAYLPEPSQG